uniref:Uncharacterized protein n=1 Tax=Anguilla anguilla TaxID=7936 RepID=A0A0E9SLC4_ANGAN
MKSLSLDLCKIGSVRWRSVNGNSCKLSET